jgi:hypothetical protein
LDTNLYLYTKNFDLYQKELAIQKRKILEVLKSQKIKHGHPHERNFLLSFFRKEDNSINFEKIPRLYLIDFDQAYFLDSKEGFRR